jgi:hypothetical protein
MQPTTIETLYRYWDGVRAGRPAPHRLEIEPSRIAAILSETFMLEHTGDGDFQFRLAGTRLCELFGYELRGIGFLDGWGDADRRTLEQLLSAVCNDAAAAHITFQAGLDADQRLELEAVLLPLMHGGKDIRRVLGAMSPISTPHETGKRRLSSRRLLRHQVVRPAPLANGFVADGAYQAALSSLTGARIVRRDRRQFRVVNGGLADREPGKT